jgi:hypothetical protein
MLDRMYQDYLYKKGKISPADIYMKKGVVINRA